MEYTIPVHMVASMFDKVDALNKRSVKLGLTNTVFARVLTGTEQIITVEDVINRELVKVNVKVVDVDITGDLPKLDGWKLVAVLSNFEGKVLVETVPGETVSEKYRTVDPTHCDHCNIKRLRNDTFVVQHEDGREMQVGRQCLRDFLGHDATALIKWGNLFAGLIADMEEFGRGSGGWGDPIYKMESVMPEVVAVVRKCGWVSRTKARNEGRNDATADLVMELQRVPVTKAEKEFAAEISEMIQTDPSIKDEAQKIIEYTQAQMQKDVLNDYEHNLSVIFDREVPIMTARTAGIACSAIAYYNNAMKQKVEREARPESNWLGSVGDKIVATITVKHKQFLESDYGTTVLLKMEDESGNQVTWFGTGQAAWDMEVDNTYTIKGSIKKCDEYKGIKQTVLTRVKVA